jgi:hypothetical protein
LEDNPVCLILGHAGGLQDAEDNAAMQTRLAALSLTVILVFRDIIEGQFPIAISGLTPVGGQFSELLSPDMQLTAIHKIRGEHNREFEAGLPLRKVRQVYILVKAAPHIPGYSEFDRLLGEFFHLAATKIFFSSASIRGKCDVVAEQRMFAHTRNRDGLRRIFANEVLVS